MKDKKDILKKAVKALKEGSISSVPQGTADATIKKLAQLGAQTEAVDLKEKITITERMITMKTLTKFLSSFILAFPILSSWF